MIHVCLYQPEIPQNTGNIIRTCMATNTTLHLIEPLGFTMDEKQCKRAALDYRYCCAIQRYSCWQEFVEKNNGSFYYVTRYGKHHPDEFKYNEVKEDIYLIFGKESTGIPKEILREHQERCIRLPMVKTARSLNLSNCVAICVYEVLRQLNYEGLSDVECLKGENWLDD